MSFRRALAVAAGTLLIGVALPWLALYSEVARRPELAVRSRHLHTHAGRLLASRPPGQSFRCRRDGLWRIDVRAVAPHQPDLGPIELCVRLDSVAGEIVRRATALPADANGEWLEIEFEPIADSGGRTVFFELRPASDADVHPLRLWTRYRGQLGAGRAWGSGTSTETVASFAVESALSGLSALALGLERLEPDATVELALFEGDAPEPVRRARLVGRRLATGFAFLTFEPIAESYARSYRAELTLSRGAVLRAQGPEPTWLAYHGALVVDAALGDMTVGGATVPREDLVFRAWSRPTARHVLDLLLERVGRRLFLAVLGWLAFVALVLHRAFDRS